MGTRENSNRCSYPECDKRPVADLVVKKRRLTPDGRYITSGSSTVAHVYLCDEHYPDMMDFVSLYTGGNDE